MGSLTIRRLDDQVKTKLRMRAASHGRSMEEEAREILRHALTRRSAKGQNFAESLRRHFRDAGGLELEIPAREPMRELPDFAE